MCGHATPGIWTLVSQFSPPDKKNNGNAYPAPVPFDPTSADSAYEPCFACGNVGNPINAGTGNKIEQEIDFIGGATTHLELWRYYNSQDVSTSAFGTGWRSSYHRTLNQQSSSSIIIPRPNGHVDTFTLQSGAWVADADVSRQLSVLSTGWQLVTDDGSIENYNSTGQLTSIATRAGLTTSLNYDSNNNLTTATGPFGHTLTFTYDSSNRVSKMTTPDGRTYKYAYDSNNNLVSVTYPGGEIRKYLYENSSFPNALTGITDENSSRFATYSYDSLNRAISSEHAEGAEKTSLSYNDDGSTTVTDALGNPQKYTFTTQYSLTKPTGVSNKGCSCGSLAYTYDTNGFLSSKTDFNGNVTTYTRNSRGLELTRTEASGTSQARTITSTWHPTYHLPLTITEPNRVTTFTYDAKGNPLTKTVTAGSTSRTWTYTYNGNGQVLTASDPDDHKTTYSYNSTGGVATITNALGQTTSITSYDANGRPLTIQDPNGLTTTLTYDTRGRLTSRAVVSETTTYTYDSVGQLTKVTLPDGSYLANTYDAAHRLTAIADNLGNRIAYTYDLMSNRTKEQVFDPSGNLAQTRAHIYDQFNRLSQDIGAQNQTTTYARDNNGNITSVTDPLSHINQLSYDALNRLIQAVDPTNAVTTVTYNANDLTTGVTDPRSLATAYTYDGLGNRTSTQSPDTGTTTKTYDAAGNVLTSTDARGMTTTFTYDALNRPASAAFADGKTVAYSYDQGTYGKGHLTAMTDASGATAWSYDLHGRVLAKQQTTGAFTLTTSYQYNSSTGKVSTMTYPSGRQLAYYYDATSGKLSSIKVDNATLLNGLTYRPFGPVASWTQGNGKTYARSFDQDGRLVEIAIGGSTPETVTLTYDAAGRITGIADSVAAPKIMNTGTTAFQYASTSNRQTSSTGGMAKTYSYDAAGNIISDGSATFTYGANGRLAQATKGGTTAYAINGLGQRVAKTGSGATTGATYFVYDEAGHLIGEYDASGNVVQETVWLGDLPVGVLKSGAVYYVNPDHLGAPLSITDANGKAVWRWDRDPYGSSKPNENPSGLGTFTYNVRLPGQYYDKETELHYNYFRDYNPKTGRYVQSDPVGLQADNNIYSYVASSPALFNDRLGLRKLNLLWPGDTGNGFAKNSPDDDASLNIFAHGGTSKYDGNFYIGAGEDATNNLPSLGYSPSALASYLISNKYINGISKVNLFSCYSGYGGSKSYAQKLADELHDRGFDVTVYAPNGALHGASDGSQYWIGDEHNFPMGYSYRNSSGYDMQQFSSH